MANNWVKIFETNNTIEAELMMLMLKENEIDAITMNKMDSSYLSFGLVEVYCQSNQVVTALHLIGFKQNE